MAKKRSARKSPAQREAAAWLKKNGLGEADPISTDGPTFSTENGGDFAWEESPAKCIDGLIIEWLTRLSSEWQQFDWDGLSENIKEILLRLTLAGLAEQRTDVNVGRADRQQTLRATILTGDFLNMVDGRLDKLAPDWTEWILGERRDVRLTPDGIRAREDIESRDEHRQTEVCLWVRRVSPYLPPRRVDGLVQIESADPNEGSDREPKKIPPEFRTFAMSKKKAASYIKPGNPDSGVEWLTNCIKDGSISCQTLSRERHVFDIRDFPESVRSAIRPK
jgi:hypothetical protein